MTKKVLIISSTFLFLISCMTSKRVDKIEVTELDIPPGTIKIADNLYFDQAEIRNIDYAEFLHWTKRVFGADSYEYKSIYPDTSLWGQLDKAYISLDTNYLTNPMYRKLSVLGVSTEQAKKFSNWRSDRVMEFILIRSGILKHRNLQTGDSPFTIEKYFSGNYENIKPSPDYLYYPEYKLLDSLQNTRTGFKNYCIYKKWKTN